MTLQIRLILLALAFAAVVGSVFYVSHLRSTIEEQENALQIAKTLNESLSSQLKSVTDDAESVKLRLAKAEETAKTIRSKVITRIERIPAPPEECKQALQWLVDRAAENKASQNADK